jgi:hypothetical protein
MIKKGRKNSNPRSTQKKKPSFKTFAFFGVLVIILVILAIVFGKSIAGSAVAKKVAPKVVPLNCTDTDLGANVFEKGTTEITLLDGQKTTYVDECKNNTVKKKIVAGVLEHYCQKTEHQEGWVQCQSGICEDGACTRRCSDTDATTEYPNGFNIYLKGTVKFQNQVKEDYCNNKNKNLLHEWYCDLKTDTSKQQPVKCSLSCGDGVCLQPKPVECNNQVKNMGLTIRYDPTADLSDSCSGCSTLTSVKSIYIYSSLDNSLMVNKGLLDEINGDATDKETDKIWISDINPSTGIPEISKLHIYYEDNNKVQYAGVILLPQKNRFAQIMSNEGVNAELYLWESTIKKIKDKLKLDIQTYQSKNSSNSELIEISWMRNKGIASLGRTRAGADTEELTWQGLTIGDRAEDFTTLSSIVIEKPKIHGSSDEVLLWIPICDSSSPSTESCEETDNGKNPEIKGNLIYKGNEYTDICANEYAISVPKTGKLKITYLGSEASLISGFFMDADPEPIEIFPENKKMAQNTVWETVYNQGDKLNFFIRVYGDKWGIGVYDHYATGQLDPYTGKQYGVITQLSDTKWRIGFEDLPGDYRMNGKGTVQHSDWDYNDEVVEIEIVAPDGGWINENPELCTGTKTSTSVLEYYCENIIKKCEFIECSLGCEDGACKKAEPAICTDSDGKKNFDTIGTCTDSTGTYNDGCSGKTQTDYYCESDKCVAANKACPLANSCSGGKCVKDTTTCDVSPYVYENAANTYCMKLDIVGTCSDAITVGYNWCTCTGNAVTQADLTNANTGQYNGYCTQDAAQTNTAALGCGNCKSASQIFKPGEYGKEICFFVQPNCGTTQVDLISSFSTTGLKFNTYIPNQKYTAIACAGPGEPSCA